tara:strand:- start:7 stop:561 length:555 start_codon:yes stop_codon:yes gene_type:complete
MNVYDYHGFDEDYKQFFEKFTNKKDYSIIELGCGNGSLCYHLEQLGFNVTGTDIQNTLEYFIGNFIIDDALNSKLNKKYDFVIDRGLIHNLIRDERRERYFDMIDRITHDESVILLKVLSPYEIRCSPFFDQPDAPYRFKESELDDLYYDIGYDCSLLKDTFFYSNEEPYLRGYFALYERYVKY